MVEVVVEVVVEVTRSKAQTLLTETRNSRD